MFVFFFFFLQRDGWEAGGEILKRLSRCLFYRFGNPNVHTDMLCLKDMTVFVCYSVILGKKKKTQLCELFSQNDFFVHDQTDLFKRETLHHQQQLLFVAGINK